MSLLAILLYIGAVASGLLLLGCWLGLHWQETAVPALWLDRIEAVEQLRALRGELELDGQYSRAEALLLFDVCSYLALEPGEIQAVIGVAWFDYIDEEPADTDSLGSLAEDDRT